jgi:stage II sporulation protein D
LPDQIIYLTRSKTGDIVELSLEEYLAGVVYAEMPASFNLEALKAQAVAARTYTKFKLDQNNHICDDPAHCQAWNADDYTDNFKKAYMAVSETKGEIITYLGEAIEAFFHASSGGKTESSENVWGKEIPYLVSVDSPNEDKIMSSFYSEKEVTYKEMREKVNKLKGSKSISTDKLKSKIKILSKTQGDRVKELKIDNVILSGTEIRNLFDLRSANFSIELKEKSIVFKVRGYGHGVGMSQWGAEAMAKEGKKYDEILKHYYPNTEIL